MEGPYRSESQAILLLIYLLIGMTLLDDVNTLLLPHVLIRARAAHYPHEVKSLPIRSAPAPNEREKSLSLSFGISRDDDLLLQAGILLLIVKVRNVVDQQDRH